MILIGMISLSLFWTTCFAPESPYFLYEFERWAELEKALGRVAKFNGDFDAKSIEFVVGKLRDQKKKDDEAKIAIRKTME
jgi:hypothetical protein